MKTIRISKEVWEKIKELGKFGETPDAVLRRVMMLPAKQSKRPEAVSTDLPDQFIRYLNKGIENGELTIRFDGDVVHRWTLPDRADHEGIRRVRDQAVEVAIRGGASFGQIAALKKTLTANGYFVRQPNGEGGLSNPVHL